MTLLHEDTVSGTPYYKVLLEHTQKLQEHCDSVEKEIKSYQHEFIKLRKDIADCIDERKVREPNLYQNSSTYFLQEAGTKEAAETKALIKKRDDDLTRLRQERFNWEVKAFDQKAKVESTTASIKELKASCDSQEASQ